MKVITRIEAAQAGLNRFYTGKPCRRGHNSERLVSSGACVECNRLAQIRLRDELKNYRRMAEEARA